MARGGLAARSFQQALAALLMALTAGSVAGVPPPSAPVASSPVWSVHWQLTSQAIELLSILRSAEDYGLAPEDYDIQSIIGDSSRQRWGQLDQALSAAAGRLVRDLHYGRVDPRAAGFDLGRPRNDLDVATTVAAIASASHVAEVLSGVEPPFYHYALLKQALKRYRALAADPRIVHLPPLRQRALRVGDVYEGASALRFRLQAEGDLRSTVPLSLDGTLDSSTSDALRGFQDRHGLPVTGRLDAATLSALNVPLAARVRQIVLTLERWRWLPRFTAPPIIVNVPEFTLFAFSGTEDRAADTLQMKVIVGRSYPATRTPIFVGSLQEVVFRPYWDVPRDITEQELLPAIRANPGYLQQNHFEIVRGAGDDAVPVAPTQTTLAALAAGELRVRQRPGDDNALGLVKFVFPNSYSVYMHDTPAHRLFQESRRAFSHGCIRVADPVALTAFVLRHERGDWNEQRISAAMHASESSRVRLATPIPVMILYGTALATEAGPVRFFDDIYGHDAKLARLLHLDPIVTGRSGGQSQ